MTPKFIYFDVGNVFMTYDKIFSRLQKELNLDITKFDSIYDPYDIPANLGQITIPEAFSKVADQLNIQNYQNYPIIESWVSDYEAITPMHELVNSISKNYKIGIISNYYRDFFQEATRQKFIPKLNFSPIIISAEIGCMKPNPEIYKIAQDKSGFVGAEILFVDDKLENMVVPSTLGWQTFVFDYKNAQKSCQKLLAILKK